MRWLPALSLVVGGVGCSDPYGEGPHGGKGPSVDTGDSPSPSDSDSGGSVESGSAHESSLPDADGDGWPDDEDCVADDASVYPGAPDAWYDGVDSDCAGNSDYDQDGDGYLFDRIGGDDCNDEDAAVHPGASDAAYDGVDADCAGDDDFDADKDGDADPLGGGEDCDDTDATVSSLALETLDDGMDSDCDGDPDSFRFTELDLAKATGLQGPRIATDSTYAMVGFLAASFYDTSSGSTEETAGLQSYFDLADPASGPMALDAFYWTSTYTFNSGFDFWASDDHRVWAYGLQKGGTRYLVADVYRAFDASYGATGWGFPTSDRFADVEISEATDGSLHLLGCDEGDGLLTWMHASPDGFFDNSDVSGDDLSGAPSSACIVQTEQNEILVGEPTGSSFDVYAYSDSFGLGADGTTLGYPAYDLDRAKKASHEGFVVAQGSSGVHLEVDGSTAELSGPATAVELELDGAGDAYVVYADGSTAHLAYGAAGLRMPEVELDPGLGSVEEIDVTLTDADMLLVVARAGNTAAWGVVALP